jgi:acyl-CoA thioesterase I
VKNQLTAFIAGTALALTLSGCGGGGGGGSPTPTQTTAAAAPTCYLTDQSNNTCVVNDAIVLRSDIFNGDQTALRALFTKMKQGGRYVIGFEGGSITRGEKVISTPGTTLDQTYTWEVYRWFQATFPKSTFDLENDAVSGTSSGQGAERYPTFAAQYKPDLVIVDFAVNDNYFVVDGNAGEVQVWYGQLMNEIVAGGAIPIALETVLPDCENAQWPDETAYASLNLPLMISEKDAICPLIAGGQLPQSDWNADGTHPNVFGHEILSQLVTQNFNRIIESMGP